MVPGRPRDDSVDDLVLTAALALMRDRGYGGLRIDDLVAQTGVAKTTMYRRWPSLAHLAVAAVERALGDRTVEPCADPAVELVRLLDRAFGSVAGDGALVATIGLDIARHDDPELHRLYRRRVIDPVRERVRELVADGMHGGALRAADPDAIADALIGSLTYRFAVLHEEPDPSAARRLVEDLLTALRPDDREADGSR